MKTNNNVRDLDGIELHVFTWKLVLFKLFIYFFCEGNKYKKMMGLYGRQKKELEILMGLAWELRKKEKGKNPTKN